MLSLVKKVMKRVIPTSQHARVAFFMRGIGSYCYHGNRFVCPCCKRRFRELLPYRDLVLNAVCPRCDSHARHRLMWLYLIDKKKIMERQIKLLHFAPEPMLGKFLCALPNIEYLSADLDSPLAMIKMDITDIPYPAESFDAILCSHVLEHVPDDRKAMSEMLRVLKPGGWAILQVPIAYDRKQTFEDSTIVSPEDRLKFYGQEDHVRFYGLDYAERLRAVGFEVNVDGYVRELDSILSKKYALNLQEDIYLCSKPVR